MRFFKDSMDLATLTGLGLTLCAAWFGVLFWFVLSL